MAAQRDRQGDRRIIEAVQGRQQILLLKGKICLGAQLVCRQRIVGHAAVFYYGVGSAVLGGFALLLLVPARRSARD
jgi:hypothetical protein